MQTAYGIAFSGLPPVSELTCATEVSSAPTVRVRMLDRDHPTPVLHPLDASRNVRRLLDGRVLALDRRAASATFYGPPLTPDVLAHPYLGPVATTFSRWLGRESFHAGAFVHEGRAWGVLGPRTAGKSTLMAALAAHRVPVLVDDVLITDGDHVFAGPRCIDLREPGPRGRGGLVPARHGTRWRLGLPAIPDRVELAGWIFLRWGPEVAMEPLAAGDLMRRLAVERAGPGMPSDAAAFLALATRPAWDLHRPQDFDQLDTTVDRLLTTLSDIS